MDGGFPKRFLRIKGVDYFELDALLDGLTIDVEDYSPHSAGSTRWKY